MNLASLLEPKQKKNRDNQQRKEAEVANFIPYACHYDNHTLLTKNGELLQTIKITGFASEQVGSAKVTLREMVRKAIFSSLDSSSYALWFHTIRRRTNLDPGGEYPNNFSGYLNDRWGEAHNWDEMYTNELFITVVREGQDSNIRHPSNFVRALLPGADRRYRDEYLIDAHECLENTVNRMMDTLTLFGAHRLQIIEQEGAYYSEPLRFLGKIINLHERLLPVQTVDLSQQLTSNKISFGFNVVEVLGEDSQHFGAVLTIKEYKELSARAIDEFLQIPQEFVISQCIDFMNPEKVKGFYSYQRHITTVSEDEELAEISGLNDIFDSDSGREIDYGEQQLSVLLLESTMDALEESVDRAFHTLNDLGIVAMREDIRLEECFWSLLPANFEFITRLKPINTARVGGFASLHNFPAGQRLGNHWGPATTIFHTAAGTPYFFNFHKEDNGHTTIIGPFGAGKTVMLNFLVAEAQKYAPRVFFFDKEQGSEIFVRALEGTYHKLVLDSQSNALRLNPLLLEDSAQNRGFLAEWVWSMLTAWNDPVDEEEVGIIHAAIADVMERPMEQRRLSVIAAHFQAAGHTRLVKMLSPWHGEGQYHFMFDNADDNLDLESTNINGFEMGNVIRQDGMLKPVLEYMLYRVTLMLDGTRTIVVLDEAWEMLDNELFAPKIHAWLDMLQENNAFAILATESVDVASKSAISSDIMDHIVTEIYLPNPDAGSAYQDVFHLNDKQFKLLRRMKSQQRHFLLKHGGDAVVATVNFSGMEDVLCVLSGSTERLELFERILAEKGGDVRNWLPAYQQQSINGGRA